MTFTVLLWPKERRLHIRVSTEASSNEGYYMSYYVIIFYFIIKFQYFLFCFIMLNNLIFNYLLSYYI